MFSIFGDDFHETDYPKFYSQGREIYPDIENFPRDTQIQKEAMYWYLVNRFFLDSVDISKTHAFIYEYYVEDKISHLQKFAGYLGVNCSDEIVNSPKLR